MSIDIKPDENGDVAPTQMRWVDAAEPFDPGDVIASIRAEMEALPRASVSLLPYELYIRARRIMQREYRLQRRRERMARKRRRGWA